MILKMYPFHSCFCRWVVVEGEKGEETLFQKKEEVEVHLPLERERMAAQEEQCSFASNPSPRASNTEASQSPSSRVSTQKRFVAALRRAKIGPGPAAKSLERPLGKERAGW